MVSCLKVFPNSIRKQNISWLSWFLDTRAITRVTSLLLNNGCFTPSMLEPKEYLLPLFPRSLVPHCFISPIDSKFWDPRKASLTLI